MFSSERRVFPCIFQVFGLPTEKSKVRIEDVLKEKMALYVLSKPFVTRRSTTAQLIVLCY